MTGTSFALTLAAPFAAPSRTRAGLTSCFRHQGKHRHDACTKETARTLHEIVSTREPSQAEDIQ